ILGLAVLASYLVRRSQSAQANENGLALPAIAAPAALVLLPLALIAFSLLVQPVMIARYALPAVLVVALVAGCMATHMNRRVAVAACLFLMLSSVEALRQHTAEMARETSWILHTVQGIRSVPANEPVICYKRDQAYVLAHAAPDLAGRITVLDYDQPYAGEPAYQILGRDFARKLNHFYPTPPLLNVEHVDPGRRFYFIAE